MWLAACPLCMFMYVFIIPYFPPFVDFMWLAVCPLLCLFVFIVQPLFFYCGVHVVGTVPSLCYVFYLLSFLYFPSLLCSCHFTCPSTVKGVDLCLGFLLHVWICIVFLCLAHFVFRSTCHTCIYYVCFEAFIDFPTLRSLSVPSKGYIYLCFDLLHCFRF